jgi:hypothetical protein
LADSNSDFIDKSKISLKKLANFNLDWKADNFKIELMILINSGYVENFEGIRGEIRQKIYQTSQTNFNSYFITESCILVWRKLLEMSLEILAKFLVTLLAIFDII